MKKDISISICVPAFNEEKSIEGAIEDLFVTLSPFLREIEVIIVDDGSSDYTSQLADQLSKKHGQIKVIHHNKNLGIGICYRDALAIATGQYFTWFPADRENSVQEFVQCLPYLREDIVVISHHRGQYPRSALRRSVSALYTRILNRYFHLNLQYYNGLAIFPTSVIRSFSSIANGFGWCAENLIRAVRCGYDIVELSFPLRERACGKSKAFTFLSMTRMVRDLFCVFMRRTHNI